MSQIRIVLQFHLYCDTDFASVGFSNILPNNEEKKNVDYKKIYSLIGGRATAVGNLSL